ncbi:MAG TPA: hypothetical protein VMV68_04310, partial [Spirochaetia bacterium]|nr:hypothetical protein [Spirochaetia bacterium]
VAIYGTGNVSAMRVTATMTDVNTGARLAAYRDMVYVSENVLGDWQAAGYTVATPAAASRIWTSGVYGYTPYAFTFVGNHALLAAERSGIMMWDTTVPSSPGVVAPGYVNVPGGYAWSVAVSGQYALIGTSSSYLDVIDLSYPNNMVPTGSVQTQGTVSSSREAVGLAVLGNYVFAANEQAGLRVVDISDPAWPQALAGYGAPGGSTDAVAVYGSYVLTADSTGGLKVYDATSVASWSASGQAAIFTSGAPATDLAVRGNFAYVARGSSGLQVWDISDPRNPVLVGTLIETGFAPLRLTVYKGFLYAIDGTSKLYVVTLIS